MRVISGAHTRGETSVECQPRKYTARFYSRHYPVCRNFARKIQIYYLISEDLDKFAWSAFPAMNVTWNLTDEVIL